MDTLIFVQGHYIKTLKQYTQYSKEHHMHVIYTQCPKLMYTIFEMLLLSKKMRQKYNFYCGLFLRLPKPILSQQ
jgi:hypothetical protein